jgi:hypothetical protein
MLVASDKIILSRLIQYAPIRFKSAHFRLLFHEANTARSANQRAANTAKPMTRAAQMTFTQIIQAQ